MVTYARHLEQCVTDTNILKKILSFLSLRVMEAEIDAQDQ